MTIEEVVIKDFEVDANGNSGCPIQKILNEEIDGEYCNNKCLKEGWISLQEFKTKYELTTWQTTRLPIKLDQEFQCKIGAVIFIFESEGVKVK